MVKIGRLIIIENRLSALPFDPRERQVAIRTNWIKLGTFVKNEQEVRLNYYRLKYGYSGRKLFSKFGRELEEIFEEYSDLIVQNPVEIISRNSPGLFIELNSDVREFENNSSKSYSKICLNSF